MQILIDLSNASRSSQVFGKLIAFEKKKTLLTRIRAHKKRTLSKLGKNGLARYVQASKEKSK